MREALVNTLVHADYSGRASILVVKEPSGFLFRNPGLLRVPLDQAMQGGASDCRNRTMQQMFLMIGLGERAGSGLPKIIHGWQDSGHFLRLSESFEPYDHAVLQLRWNDGDGVNDGKTSGKTSGISSGKILDAIRGNAGITIPELSARIGVTERSIERNINTLQKNGRLRRSGPAKGGHWEIVDDH